MHTSASPPARGCGAQTLADECRGGVVMVGIPSGREMTNCGGYLRQGVCLPVCRMEGGGKICKFCFHGSGKVCPIAVD